MWVIYSSTQTSTSLTCSMMLWDSQTTVMLQRVAARTSWLVCTVMLSLQLLPSLCWGDHWSQLRLSVFPPISQMWQCQLFLQQHGTLGMLNPEATDAFSVLSDAPSYEEVKAAMSVSEKFAMTYDRTNVKVNETQRLNYNVGKRYQHFLNV